MARVVAPGCWHHVTQRGNQQQTTFCDPGDREFYIRLLRRYSVRYGVRVAGFCLMGNHIHLLAIPAGADSLARTLSRLHNDYSRWLNLRHARTGHVWQNRFYSCPLDEGHQWEALRYVELNPVRAGLADRAEDWPWSSARASGGRRSQRAGGLFGVGTAMEPRPVEGLPGDGDRRRLSAGSNP